MNKKNENSEDNELKTAIGDPEALTELMIAARILKEASGIVPQDYIDKTTKKMETIVKVSSKDIFEDSAFTALKSSDNLTKPIKFFGRINSISDSYPLRFEGSSVEFDAIDIEMIDLNGSTVKAIPVVGEKKKKKLQDLKKQYSEFCFYGTVLYGLKDRDSSKAKDKNNLEYKFFILDVDPADESQKANGQTDDEKLQKLFDNKDAMNELMVASRILIETSDYHPPDYYKKVMEKMGIVLHDVPKHYFKFRESLSGFLKDEEIPKPVKFYGSIFSISAAYPMRFKSTSGQIANFNAIYLVLKDGIGDTIKTIPLVTNVKKKKIKKLVNSYSLFCFYGIPLFGLKKGTKKKKINMDDLEYRFFIMDLEPAENLLEINNFSKTEIKNAKKLIKKLRTKNYGIQNYILFEVIKGLGIKGLKDLPLLRKSLEFLVLQSFSDYTIGTRSAKLHSLIIGPPAVGKGKLAEVVQVLNYIYNDASGIRWSSAGLIAKSQSGDGKNKSEPGLIPLSHRGVFAMQDFHEAKNKRDLFGIFSQVMEDGIISDSMVSRTKHRALTSIHLDTNKLPDVYLDDSKKFTKSRYRELKKIGIPLHILSRFDFIADIKRDLELQKRIGREMLDSESGSKPLISDLVQELWVRELQAIVAILRTDFPDVTFPHQIAGYMQKKYDELTSKVDSNIEYISDFLPRLSQSFKKIVIATSRANARNVSTKDDVDYAFGFLQLKLDFLMTVKPEGAEEDGQSNMIIPPEYLISIKFEGEIITLPEAREYVNSHIDNPVGNRQIRRYLKDNFNKAGRGKWKIDKLTS